MTRAKEIPFSDSARVGHTKPAQRCATLECAWRALLDVRLAIVLRTGRLEAIGVEEIQPRCTKRELVLVQVHAQRALGTPCSAHYLDGTLKDRRNGQKGMLGTRIIHVLCPWWKRLFAATATDLVSEERGDERSSPNWRGFLRGRRRKGAAMAHRTMGRHLTSLGKAHLNSVTDVSAFSCT